MTIKSKRPRAIRMLNILYKRDERAKIVMSIMGDVLLAVGFLSDEISPAYFALALATLAGLSLLRSSCKNEIKMI